MKKKILRRTQFVTVQHFDKTMAAIKQAMVTKDELKRELKKWTKAIIDHFDALIENRMIDLGAAKKERVELIENRTDKLDERVTILERHSGLPRG